MRKIAVQPFPTGRARIRDSRELNDLANYVQECFGRIGVATLPHDTICKVLYAIAMGEQPTDGDINASFKLIRQQVNDAAKQRGQGIDIRRYK